MKVSQESRQVRDLRVKADQAYSQMKWKKALELYKEVEQLAPNDARTGQRIADLYRRFGQNQEAVAYYKKVADHYSKDGYWAKAIAVQKMVLELDPGDVTVQGKLAEMYSKQGVQGRTIQQATPPPDTVRVNPADPQEAIPLSEMDTEAPHMDATNSGVFGGTISIAGATPRSYEEPPIETEAVDDEDATQALGRPVSQFSGIPLLSEMNTDELFAVLSKLKVIQVPSGALICEEGDVGKSMYVIADGWVEVFTKDKDGGRIPLARMRGGDFFGEYGLLASGVRNASVQAKIDTELLEITSADFDAIAAQHPRIWNVLEEYLRHRMTDTILKKSPVFRHLTDDERAKMISVLRVQKFKMDTTVMEEGTDGDEMFFVKSGTLSVTAAGGKDRISLEDLGPGDYVGEIAMLTGKPRTATVRTRSDCELFCLSRKDAAMILRNNRDILMKLKETIEQRTKDKSEAIRSYEEARHTLGLV